MSDDVVTAYQAEIGARAVSTSPVTVVSLDEQPASATAARPGTATIFWAAAGTQALDDMTDAFRAPNDARALEIIRAEPEFDLETVVHRGEGFASVPALGELRYSAKTIVEAVTYLPGSDSIATCELVYTGGHIFASRFTAVSYCLPGATPVGFVVILNPPPISPREKRLLASVPEQLSEVHLSEMQPRTTPAVGAAATFAARAVAAAAAAKAVDYTAQRAQHWAHNVERNQAKAQRAQNAREHAAQRAYPGRGLTEASEIPTDQIERLERLDPAAAAHELLAMRAELLSRSD